MHAVIAVTLSGLWISKFAYGSCLSSLVFGCFENKGCCWCKRCCHKGGRKAKMIGSSFRTSSACTCFRFQSGTPLSMMKRCDGRQDVLCLYITHRLPNDLAMPILNGHVCRFNVNSQARTANLKRVPSHAVACGLNCGFTITMPLSHSHHLSLRCQGTI